MILLLRLPQKDRSVRSTMQADSRSRPTAESCNAAIAVKENTSDSKSAKITKFLFLDFASYVGVEGVALAHHFSGNK